MSIKESWRLKLDRAEQHLKEFDTMVALYASRHPYVVERVQQPKGQRHIWAYRLRFTEQPEPMMALVLGDAIHNMRSSLDHIRAALVPSERRNKLLYFPIESVDPWATDNIGRYLVPDDEIRSRYLSAVKGMADEAKAIIEAMQPYKAREEDRQTHPSEVLNRLDNADKHRRLAVLAAGLDQAISIATAGSEIVGQRVPGFAQDGAEISKFGFHNRPVPPESEVHVAVCGTPRISVDIGLEGGNVPEASQMSWHILNEMRRGVVELEPFVKL